MLTTVESKIRPLPKVGSHFKKKLGTMLRKLSNQNRLKKIRVKAKIPLKYLTA